MPIVLILLFLLPFANALANDSTVYQQYNYTLQHGLAFNNILDIEQDSTGFIWIATENGLSRFDGTVFKNYSYSTTASNGLLGNYVQAMLVDKDGALWVSSRKGISKYDNSSESFSHYPILAGVEGQHKMDVGCISNASDKNTLWISANGLGIYHFQKKTGTFQRYTTQNVRGLRSNMVTSLLEDNQGRLWVGSQNAGIQVFSVTQKGLEPYLPLEAVLKAKPYLYVHHLYEDYQGNIWAATNNGLFRYNTRYKTSQWITAKDLGIPSEHILSIVSDKNNMLFIGVLDGGGYRFAYQESKNGYIRMNNVSPLGDTEQSPDGISARSITSLLFDRDQHLWAGSYGDGLFLITKPTYHFFTLGKTKLIAGKESQKMRFYGIAEDGQGNLFVGTDGHGLFKLNAQNQVIARYVKGSTVNHLSDNAILVAYKDHANHMWFGTYSGGLLAMDEHHDTFTSFRADPSVDGTLGANDVRTIYEDSHHQLWVGTNGGGLNKLNAGTGKFTKYVQQNSIIPSNDIRCMIEDKAGNLIIGTYGAGITYFEQKKELFSPYFPDKEPFNKLKNEVIYDIAILSDGNLWVATESNGLLVYDMQKRELVRVLEEKAGLASNTVLAIKQDNNQQCWVSTIKGLSSIHILSKKITNYGAASGVQSGMFNQRAAHYSMRREQLFFAGTGGLTYFNPLSVRQQLPQRPLVLTGLEVMGKEHPLPNQEDPNITLSYDQSTITIHYSPLEYGQSNDRRFTYRLTGLDKQWNFIGNEQAATYRYLSPGRYTFEVAQEQGGHIIPKSLKKITIEVLPPWYRTGWAYLLYFCTLSILLYYYRRHRLQKQQLHYQLQLAKLEREKDKEISDLKINHYTRLSHEFRSTLTLILQPVKELLKSKDAQGYQDPSVNTLYTNTNRLLRLANQSLTFRKDDLSKEKLNLENVDLVELINEILNCFNHQINQKKITVTFETARDELVLLADREKIEMVLFNLIFNAVKFTTHGWLKIKLALEDPSLIAITIKDSGCGIDKNLGNKLFEPFVHHSGPSKNRSSSGFGVGLWMAKSLLELHNGSIRFESELGKGTTFYLIIPLQNQEQPPSTLDSDLQENKQDQVSSIPHIPKVSHSPVAEDVFIHGQKILIVDDDLELCLYLKSVFEQHFQVYLTHDTEEAQQRMDQLLPDIVLCDVMMKQSNGIDLCRRLKIDARLKHIPIILLTAAHNTETKLEGLESGADDYITKPFEVEVLKAKVNTLLKSRDDLKDYFFHHVTSQTSFQKISSEDRALHDKCLQIIESNLTDPQFNVHKLAAACDMSYATLSNRIKDMHNLTLNSFIRKVRLHAAAKRFLSSDATIYEVAYQVGMRDLKYFREQFAKQYQMNPSEYIKQYRSPFHNIYHSN